MKHIKPLIYFAAASVLPGVSSAQAAPKPMIQVVSPQGLQSAIRAQKGKVVLVNFWATWCAPCVAELPALSQLQKRYGARGVRVLLVSADDASARAKVAQTLTERGHSKSLLIQGDMVAFFERFDPKFRGAVALPRTYIYNRSGQRVKAVALDHTATQYGAMLKPYL